MSTATLVTFIIYLLGMLGIGLWAFYQTKNLTDYILGGRKLGSLVTALSASATDMSGWLLLGLPGAIYFTGLSEMWIGVGLAIGAYYNWKITAPRLRVYTEEASNSITLPDFFTNRFEDKSNALRLISAVVILVFFTLYVASGLTAGAKLFEASFAMDYHYALWIGALVIVSYTFFGGFLAVSWTDVIQGLLMVTALVIAPLTIWFSLGHEGISQAVKQSDQTIIESCQTVESQTSFVQSLANYSRMDEKQKRSNLEKLEKKCQGIKNKTDFRSSWFAGQGALEFFFSFSFLSLMAWGLGYYGQPHLLARFMATKSVPEVHKARKIAMSWMITSMLGAISIGYLAIAYFGSSSVANTILLNKETVFIEITQVLFSPWIAGFLLAAILAAVMSTVDSQLLVSSSAVTEDFYKPFIRKSASDSELVWVGRSSVILIAVIALVIASDRDSSVLKLVGQAWAGFGAAFGPVIVISLLWRQMTRVGAIAGIVSGALTVLIWIGLQNQFDGIVDSIYAMIPGVLISLIGIYVGSRYESASDEMLKTFDRVQEKLKSS